MARHGIWWLAVLVAALGLAGYWLGGSGLLEGDGEDRRPLISLESVDECTLDPQGCVFPLDQGHLTVRGPTQIRPLAPLSLILEGPEFMEGAQVLFTMEGMDMGLNLFRFEQTAPAQWKARVTLPVCTVDRVDWQAMITVDLGDHRARMVIGFETR